MSVFCDVSGVDWVEPCSEIPDIIEKNPISMMTRRGTAQDVVWGRRDLIRVFGFEVRLTLVRIAKVEKTKDFARGVRGNQERDIKPSDQLQQQ